MRDKANKEIRDALRIADMRQWELADALGISEFTLCSKLRRELEPETKEHILSIIKGGKKK